MHFTVLTLTHTNYCLQVRYRWKKHAWHSLNSSCYSMVMALSVEADTSLKLRLRTSWRMLVIQTEDYEITFFTSISCLGLKPNHWHSNNVHSTDTTHWERWAVTIKTKTCVWTTTSDEECCICPYISQTQTVISAWWQCNIKKFPLSYILSCLSRPQGPLVWRPIWH